MRRLILTAIVCGGAFLASFALATDAAAASARATDLLTAKHAATQAQKRLELPVSRGAGWVPGGNGFGHRGGDKAPAEREPDVHIHLGGGRRKLAAR